MYLVLALLASKGGTKGFGALPRPLSAAVHADENENKTMEWVAPKLRLRFDPKAKSKTIGNDHFVAMINMRCGQRSLFSRFNKNLLRIGRASYLVPI